MFASYFTKSLNSYDQFVFVLLSPVTICSTVEPFPDNTYLIEAGRLPLEFESSFHVLLTFTEILSSGTLNVFTTLNPAL